MLKIPIKKLESVTGYKVKRDYVAIGLDLATKTGYSILTSSGKNIIIDCGFLQFDSSNQKEMYKNMYTSFKKLIQKEDLVVIENTHYQRNADVVIKLSRFGGFAIACCIEAKVPYQLIGATSSRSKLKIDSRKFGSGKSKQAVAFWLKDKLAIDLGLELNDVSDAIILGLLGMLEEMDFRSQDEIKKAKKK